MKQHTPLLLYFEEELLFGYFYGFVGGVKDVRHSALIVGELPE